MNALRRLWLPLMALLVSLQLTAGAQAVYVPSVQKDISGLVSSVRQANSAIIDRPGLFDSCEVTTAASDGTKVTDNIWLYHAFTVDNTGVRITLVNYYDGPNETKGSNPVVYRVALEYPVGTYYQFLFNGSQDVVVQPGGVVTSDPIPILMLASVGFCHTRLNVSVAAPPSSLAAVGSASGGTLAAATYYYKVTCLTQGAGESSALTEVNYVASGSTSSVALTWTAPVPTTGPLAPISYNLYRGTATNTETLMTTVMAGSVGYTDTGALTPGAITVPAARTWPTSTLMATSGSNKGDDASTTYVDKTTSGTITTNTAAHTDCPVAMSAYPTGFPVFSQIGVIGTSIGAGYSDANSTDGYGFINRSLIGSGKVGKVNIATPSDGWGNFNTWTNSYRRLSLLESCNYVITEEGANDYGNSPVDFFALSVALQKQLYAMGKKQILTTLIPRVGSTDQCATIGNQTTIGTGAFGTYYQNGTVTSATNTTITVPTISTFTASKYYVTILTGTGAGQARLITGDTTTVLTVSPAWTTNPDSSSTWGIKCTRVEYNDWIRAGCPVDGSGVATPSGCTTVLANPYGVTGYLEIADVCESARNSGFWTALNGFANGTGSVSSATSTTLVDSGKAWTTNQWNGYYVRILTGTGAGGKAGSIASNTGTTLTVASWPTTQPDNTSTYEIVKTITQDGVHPNSNITPTMANVITTAINAGVMFRPY